MNPNKIMQIIAASIGFLGTIALYVLILIALIKYIWS